MSIPERRFPFFAESADPDGTAGWQAMYPDFLVPLEEDEAADNHRFWFCDTMHWARGCYPFDSIGVEATFLGAGQYSTRMFVLPAARGLDVRIVKGYVYISPIAVEDPQEIADRARLYQERAGYYFANWDRLYDDWTRKVGQLTREVQELTFAAFPEFEPLEAITEGRGRSGVWEVISHYRSLIEKYFVGFEYHFEFLNLSFGGFVTFAQFCRQAFPLISEQDIARMVAGVDGVSFQPAAELRSLAELAVELDVVGAIGDATDVDQVLDRLHAHRNGATWLSAFDDAKDPWFNYFSDYGFAHTDVTWADDLRIPLQGIARYAGKILAGEQIHRPVKRLHQERDDLVAEYRSLLTPDEAGQFDGILALVRTVYPYIENHNIYIEHWFQSAFWRKVRELGQFLVDMSFFEQIDDIFYCNRFEIDKILYDVCEAWVIGRPARTAPRWKKEVASRRVIVAGLKSVPPAPAYGVPPAQVTDPLAVINYGITTDRINDWLGGPAADDRILSGVPGSQGSVEGIVRILKSEKDVALLQAGEILVAPTTAPSWGAAFAVAAGVITDIGGMLSHTAILCREYGIPAVVGTGVGTQRLHDGQHVRVEGDTGQVVILETAAAR